MKIPSLTVLGASAALLLSLGVSSPGWAFSLTQALGVPAGATDVVQFVCPAGTDRVRGIVVDRNPPAAVPLVNLTLSNPLPAPVCAGSTTAPQEGVSPFAQCIGGPGIYYGLISKTAAGAEVYTTRIECYNAAGGILPAAGIGLIVNQ
jgi:hypothetical protein